jgi:hypothetical protein
MAEKAAAKAITLLASDVAGASFRLWTHPIVYGGDMRTESRQQTRQSRGVQLTTSRRYKDARTIADKVPSCESRYESRAVSFMARWPNLGDDCKFTLNYVRRRCYYRLPGYRALQP